MTLNEFRESLKKDDRIEFTIPLSRGRKRTEIATIVQINKNFITVDFGPDRYKTSVDFWTLKHYKRVFINGKMITLE